MPKPERKLRRGSGITPGRRGQKPRPTTRLCRGAKACFDYASLGRQPRLTILPRKGEVSPKVTEGEGTEQTCRFPPPPSGYACHLPLAGEDR
ncbi:hypothetical protein C8J41_102392 [Sphingomonas sp. PP-CC-3G-468]|nr:hypothetical protein C8J41_102392 [Sphingomonas sp. PP-CC-3G-468]